jgi:hypothetical protein
MVDQRKKLHARDKRAIPTPKRAGGMAEQRVGPRVFHMVKLSYEPEKS